mmetsp:Transcript_39480/g.58004  ORF Transcript_39480/g.58004 Transcript_39480/m.58004 type:complete len:339 (+) Transcript_39480:52-1068(+)|eukprot:CAMPEP_0195528580 /NCGR_PEP_ID=MMETSP0794_2-20130614/30775_1 /TAXON_ID=515487 /ORGANISM="Stephanopyxis turris, Strain CCMP 815" /LENGTH=338 /DNA_ID=CAMNT_0040659739 /DNA_START=32 /DNA_END=1048 /DNA_ORIENTATION=+
MINYSPATLLLISATGAVVKAAAAFNPQFQSISGFGTISPSPPHVIGNVRKTTDGRNLLTGNPTCLQKQQHSDISSSSTSRCVLSMSHGSNATPLPLSQSDLERLQGARNRCKTIPIMILDAMLPKQRLEFHSDDPRFRKLIEYTLCNANGTLGMIGLNPQSGRPLNNGVIVSLTPDNVKEEYTADRESNVISISVQGLERFEVQGSPWQDETKSFYTADIELLQDRVETLTLEERKDAQILNAFMPNLVERWLDWVVNKEKMASMDALMADIGPMPNNIGDRAFWVAALINPIPSLGVCLEIRPVMLSCTNDLDRIKLATASIQASIDHISGKKSLF